MEMETGIEETEKQKEKQEEEHHIDKKQKTENQQDEAAKVRRPRKLPHNKKLFPGRGIPWDLFYGCQQLDILMHPPACYRSRPYVTMYGYEAAKILEQGDRKKLRESFASTKW